MGKGNYVSSSLPRGAMAEAAATAIPSRPPTLRALLASSYQQFRAHESGRLQVTLPQQHQCQPQNSHKTLLSFPIWPSWHPWLPALLLLLAWEVGVGA